MKSTALALLLFAAVSSPACAQTNAKTQNPNPQPRRITIEATELDKKMLLEKLNVHGADHKLRFVLAEKDFDYRIVFSTGQRGYQTGYGEMNSSGSSVQVFDSKGTELFAFNRAGRATDSGATNAAAKEIIKRLRKLQ
jgi:hypothetical protein